MKFITSQLKKYTFASFILLLLCLSLVSLNFILERDTQFNTFNDDSQEALDKYPKMSNDAIIFQDDFESYTVDTFPSGYTLTYIGSGASDQKVTDSQAASGSKSLTLHGVDGSLAAVDRAISYTSDILTLEGNLMSETL